MRIAQTRETGTCRHYFILPIALRTIAKYHLVQSPALRKTWGQGGKVGEGGRGGGECRCLLSLLVSAD